LSDQYQENWKSALGRAISDSQQLTGLLTAARGQRDQKTTVALIEDCDRFIEKIRVNIQIAKVKVSEDS
jgi:hypothetical protein